MRKARRLRKWPKCPDCNQDGESIDPETLTLHCYNPQCPVDTFQSDEDGNILNATRIPLILKIAREEGQEEEVKEELARAEKMARAEGKEEEVKEE